MNKERLHCKLEKLLPPNKVEYVYMTIISYEHFDQIVDVRLDDGKVRCITTEYTPREYLKNAALHYFDSKMPSEFTTCTQVEKAAKSARREFDIAVTEAISEMIKELEE